MDNYSDIILRHVIRDNDAFFSYLITYAPETVIYFARVTIVTAAISQSIDETLYAGRVLLPLEIQKHEYPR